MAHMASRDFLQECRTTQEGITIIESSKTKKKTNAFFFQMNVTFFASCIARNDSRHVNDKTNLRRPEKNWLT